MYLYIHPERVFSDSNKSHIYSLYIVSKNSYIYIFIYINIYLNKLRSSFWQENCSSENSEGYIFFHRHVSS